MTCTFSRSRVFHCQRHDCHADYQRCSDFDVRRDDNGNHLNEVKRTNERLRRQQIVNQSINRPITYWQWVNLTTIMLNKKKDLKTKQYNKVLPIFEKDRERWECEKVVESRNIDQLSIYFQLISSISILLASLTPIFVDFFRFLLSTIWISIDFSPYSVTTSFQCIRDAPRMTGGADSGGNGNDSSESETENNDDLGTSIKFLLLVLDYFVDLTEHC